MKTVMQYRLPLHQKKIVWALPGQSLGAPESYTTVNEYTTDIELTGENIQSADTDENAVLVSDGAEVSIGSVAVTSYGHKTACHGKQTVIKLHCIVIGLF